MTISKGTSMPAFHFIAINPIGQEQKGVMEAESEKHARQLLRDKSLVPLTVKTAREKITSQKVVSLSTLFRRRGVNAKELAVFTRQLATLIAAGLPVEEALLAVGEQMEKPRLQGLILSVRGKVLEGHTLASALRDHPEIFSALYCATVTAGEKSGFLDKVLLRLADYTEQQARLRQKIQTALIYPAMIVCVSIAIVGFLLEYVVPKMIAVYANLKQALPLLTQILIGISHFIHAYGLYVLLTLAAMIYFWRRALQQQPLFREKTHHFLLRLPWLSHPIKTVETARFARTFAILSASGVSVLEAMLIASKLVTIIPIRQALEIAVDHVREGAPVYLALKQSNFFPPMSVHLIASGEASGQLDNMLERAAQQQEEDITRLIELSLALFEPIIILLMGAIVLFIVLAVLLPIFQLNQNLG